MTTYAGLYGPEALIDSSGHAITSAVIDVFTHGTTTHVSLYQDNARGTPLSNPVPNGVDGSTAGRGLDTFGNLSFYVDPGRYDLRIATGAGTRTVEIEIETDPAETAASGGAFADKSRWATSTAYVLGDIVSYQGDRYICGTAHTSGAAFDPVKFIRISNLLQWWHVDDFGAKGDGQAVWDAAMTAASATLTSATGRFVSGDVGKPITVHGAGATAGGVNCPLVTTISAYVSATQVTLAATASNTTSAATAVWCTDDQAAIQSAINTVATLASYTGHGPGKLLFRDAIYGIAGAIDSTRHSQLFFPTFDNSVGGTVGVELCGSAPSGGGCYYVGATIPGTVTPPMGGTILWGLKTAIGDGSHPSILSANVNGATFNYINVRIRDITFRNFGATGMDHVDLTWAQCAEIRNVNLDVSTAEAMDVSAFGQQTSLRMPTNNNGAWSMIDGLVVYGGHTGVLASEHTHFKSASIMKCYNGVVGDAANHPWHFDRLLIQACKNSIAASAVDGLTPGTAGVSTFHGGQLDVEHALAGSWYSTTYDINDPSNHLAGLINAVTVIVSGTGKSNAAWAVNSATGVTKTLV